MTRTAGYVRRKTCPKQCLLLHLPCASFLLLLLGRDRALCLDPEPWILSLEPSLSCLWTLAVVVTRATLDYSQNCLLASLLHHKSQNLVGKSNWQSLGRYQGQVDRWDNIAECYLCSLMAQPQFCSGVYTPCGLLTQERWIQPPPEMNPGFSGILFPCQWSIPRKGPVIQF